MDTRKQIIKSLNDSFLITESELIHIERVHNVSSILFYTSETSHYKETHLQVTATSYQLLNDTIQKEKINDMFVIIDTSRIVQLSDNNIALLMIDEQELVRQASYDYWKSQKAS
jgi:hypothetical protein